MLGVILENAHPLAQSLAYHRFADTRPLFGIARAADVLSNIPILLVGLYGLLRLGRQVHIDTGRALFFFGLATTGLGSMWYHLTPDNASLIWDRLPMAWTFAGVLGVAFTSMTRRAWNLRETFYAMVVASLTVFWWVKTGSLWPYVLLQFGGMAVLAGCLLFGKLKPAKRWIGLLATYAIAKALESGDIFLWELLSHTVSGHTLKHLVCALAGLWLLPRRGKAA